MDNSTLLTVRDLCAWYTPDKQVLSDFSIELGTNEIVGLIGLNGAGKTTFIKILSGLMDHFQLGSAIWEGGRFSFRDRAFKQNRYTVFAEDHSFQYFTFGEYLSYAASAYGKKLSDISGLISGFHFEEYVDVLFKDLSTGNLKKAYLITAFALRPRLLLLDEPVNGLDFQSTEYLYKQMNEYRQYGTVLFSSHILESICMTSDRVLVLEQGKIRHSFAGREITAGTIREALGEYGTF